MLPVLHFAVLDFISMRMLAFVLLKGKVRYFSLNRATHCTELTRIFEYMIGTFSGSCNNRIKMIFEFRLECIPLLIHVKL